MFHCSFKSHHDSNIKELSQCRIVNSHVDEIQFVQSNHAAIYKKTGAQWPVVNDHFAQYCNSLLYLSMA